MTRPIDVPTPKKHLARFRPKGPMTSEQLAFYSPERDLARVGPHIFAGACSLLFDKDQRDQWQTDYMVAHNISEEELFSSMEKMQLYFKEAADPANKRIEQAVEKSGFLNVRSEVKVLFWSRVGQNVMGLLFPFIRQMSDIEPKTTFGRMDALFDDVAAYVRKLESPKQE